MTPTFLQGCIFVALGIAFIILNKYFVAYIMFLNDILQSISGSKKTIRNSFPRFYQFMKLFFSLAFYFAGIVIILVGFRLIILK